MERSFDNRMFRAAAGAAAALLAAAALSACGSDSGSGASGGGGSDGKEIKLALLADSLTGTWPEQVQAMKREVANYNEANPSTNVTLTIEQANSDVAQQISQAQTVAVKKPDVAMFSAVDTKGSLPGVTALKQAGVKVLDLRPAPPGEEQSDEFDVAVYASWEPSYQEAMVNWLKASLEKNPAEKLNIGIIYGAPAQVPQLGRGEAIKEFAKQNPDQVKVVATAYGNWAADIAQNITQDWLTAHPDMNVLVTANSDMAQGAWNALKAAGAEDKVQSAGYDVLKDAVARVKAGQQTVAVGAPAPAIARDWVELAIETALGRFKDNAFYNKDVWALTEAEVPKYEAEFGK